MRHYSSLTKQWAIAVSSLLAMFVHASAFASAPGGAKVVDNFEIERYTGLWYEVARLDHYFERDMSNVTAQYRGLPNGKIEVINRGFKEKKSAWGEAKGSAKFTGQRDQGALKVTFFWPFSAAYFVVALDKENYQWAMVMSDDTDYLWILSRTPTLDPTIQQQLLSQAKSYGIKVDELIWVKHDRVKSNATISP